jgi:hypothetical protein
LLDLACELFNIGIFLCLCGLLSLVDELLDERKFIANQIDLRLQVLDFAARLLVPLVFNFVFAKDSLHVLEFLLLFMQLLHLLFGLL